MSRRIPAALSLALVALAGVVHADDTTWTRAFLNGRHCLPARVRCSGEAVYVAGSTTTSLTMAGFVLRYSAEGDLDWVTTVESHGYDVATALAVGPDGSVVAGFDAGTVVAQAVLVKLDSLGDTLWTRVYNNAAVRGLAVRTDGSVYLVGTRGPLIQDSLWLAKLTAAGAPVWTRYYRLATGHTVDGFGVDGTGASVVELHMADKAEWSELVRFSPSGDSIWRRTLAGVTNFLGMAVRSDGVVFANSNSGLKKVDVSGAQVWSKSLPSGTLARDAACDADGNVYVAYADNTQDYKVRKYNGETGATMYNLRCALPSQDLPLTVAVDAGRRPVVAGTATESSTMRALTARFSGLPGVAEPRVVSPPGRATLVCAGGRVRGRAETAGEYVFSVFDCSGRLEARNRNRLAAGGFDLPLPEVAPGLHCLVIDGPVGRTTVRFVRAE